LLIVEGDSAVTGVQNALPSSTRDTVDILHCQGKFKNLTKKACAAVTGAHSNGFCIGRRRQALFQ
jgi:DNA gyrase/topoisomerase IV subunit B